MKLQPERTVAELRELQTLTGNIDGAQRVAWTDPWYAARDWLHSKLSGLPLVVTIDEAGNCWTTLHGKSKATVVIGGHLDSVPNGGWLDGALNIVAGSEVLRRIACQGIPPVTVSLVDWADEEGARFGRSLYGSSAVSGSLNIEDLRALSDRAGNRLPDVLRASPYGITLDNVKKAGERLRRVAAYVELHIEQGPVLERLQTPLATVLGTVGIKRHAITFSGQSAHAGTTPMEVRRDAFLASAKLALSVRDIAMRHGGVGTVGSVVLKPGISSAVPGQCDLLLEQRHLDAGALDAMVAEARHVSEQCAGEEGVSVEWRRIWEIPPMPFDAQLIELADAAVRETAGGCHRMPSGALHDASEMARAGIPTVMLFVQSLQGLSHTKEEDTREDHLHLSVAALDRLVDKVVARVADEQ